MQSAPFKTPETASLENVTNDNADTSQYGLSPPARSASPAPQQGWGELESLQDAHAAALNDAATSDGRRVAGDTTEAARLKRTNTPPRDRISEHESASSTPRKLNEGPAFVVMKKSRRAGDDRSPIADLPSGTPRQPVKAFND